MEDENGIKQAYWEGVRDAFELVLNAVDWSLAHPEVNFDFYTFLHRSLSTAKKHCQPRLADLLGVDFNIARKDRVIVSKEIVQTETQEVNENENESVENNEEEYIAVSSSF